MNSFIWFKEWLREVCDAVGVQVVAAVVSLLVVGAVAVVMYELYYMVSHYVRWRLRSTLANRRRLRAQRERDRQWVIGVLRRRLDRLEGLNAD